MSERKRGPAEAPNRGDPAVPRPSASVVLLRRGGKHGDRALEVLLLKRTEKAKFMPGVWVFPGGGVDPEDGTGEEGHRAAAGRELHEERSEERRVGKECRSGGGWGACGCSSVLFMPGVWVFPGAGVDPEDGTGEEGHRAAAVRELHEEAGIELSDGEELILFSRWITPEVVSRRFDAWFFLALAPAHTPPEPDGVETVEARWFEPRAALHAQGGGAGAPALPPTHPADATPP